MIVQMRMAAMGLFAATMLALPAAGSDSLQWSGFALLRGGNSNVALPLDDNAVTAQVQLGIDWRPSLILGAHLHLLARNDDDGSRRGRAGIVEAYLEQNLVRGEHRFHFLEGAFFLPSSRENVDALWESPYTITPSALNSWLGEEFRPIGIDASYTLRHQWSAGVTVYRGNDTFGALPPERGWALHDRWTVLGEHVPVDSEYFTSVSAETDGTLGWAGRARWNNDHGTVQLTHIDNRSDALDHGELLNWNTQFDIAGGDYTIGDWTAAAEYGWGVTRVTFGGVTYPTDISAGYVLVSRRIDDWRVSVRGDEFSRDDERRHAVTAAVFWSPRGKLRAGVEAIVAGDERRVAAELRYSFAGR
ncbi:MAG: hypothetical protein JWO97_3198 [Acidobacteria bacterium]|nr:hypothetical protein [Acidobacteriota bacterium]